MKRVSRVSFFASVICLLVIGSTPAQSKTSKARNRVNSIIEDILKRGEFTTNQGYRAVTRVLPSDREIAEIKELGDRAIAPLAEHFSSTNGMECDLAMRLMGALGGARIIEPLKQVILFDPSAAKRMQALRWITQGPWDQAADILRLTAENDPDPKVRDVAKDLLLGYAPK